MQKRKDILRNEQKELKKCIDEYFDNKMTDLCQEERAYMMQCKHPYMIIEKTDDGESQKCPECGFWNCWGTYKPIVPPIPYQHKDKIEELLKSTNIEEKWKLT